MTPGSIFGFESCEWHGNMLLLEEGGSLLHSACLGKACSSITWSSLLSRLASGVAQAQSLMLIKEAAAGSAARSFASLVDTAVYTK